ncbi:hypothetical protein KC19_1G101400 [Ceratodon purpureus]|uniref:Uncharacterized protein n=1 Tax=Ceratodon purpureus TaxID=3225 RepID=A0A8T0J6M0_CERPU|nr:hypothetical protein KC19_1G101400 [Ceratodon purpureus]
MPITGKNHRERSTKTKSSIYAKPQHSTRSNLPLQTLTQMPGPSNSLTPRIRETLDLGRMPLNPLPSPARFPNASRMTPPAATSPRKTPENHNSPTPHINSSMGPLREHNQTHQTPEKLHMKRHPNVKSHLPQMMPTMPLMMVVTKPSLASNPPRAKYSTNLPETKCGEDEVRGKENIAKCRRLVKAVACVGPITSWRYPPLSRFSTVFSILKTPHHE